MCFCLLILLTCCKSESAFEKYFDSHITANVQKYVKELPMEDVLMSTHSKLNIANEFLIISDWRGYDKLIHIFDKNTFQHIVSTTETGQGPNEIAYLGSVCIDEDKRKFYVFDYGKQRLFNYSIDSLIANPNYEFTTKARLDKKKYPIQMHYISDTFSIAKIVDVDTNTGGAVESFGAWNMTTGEFKKGYRHPKQPKRALHNLAYEFTASSEQGIYVMANRFYDLLTICDLNGSLKCNIYGPNWTDDITKSCHYNMDVRIGKDKIFALYSGAHYQSKDFHPSKIVIFDANGNYLKTLETGFHLLSFCYDKEKHRLIFLTNDEMQFGYLDLEGII